MKKIILIITLFFVLLFSACSNQAISQSTLNTSNINISEYFPTNANLITTYNTYSNNQLFSTETHMSYFVNRDKDHETYETIEKSSSLSSNKNSNVPFENHITYAINHNSIIQSKSVNIGTTGITNSTPVTILINKTKWNNENDNIICSITDIDKTITTKAGTFSKCIEVTEESKLNDETVYSKKYYAPKLGLILITLKKENSSDYTTFEELTNYKYTSMSFSKNSIDLWIDYYYKTQNFKNENLRKNMIKSMSSPLGFSFAFYGKDLSNVFSVEAVIPITNDYQTDPINHSSYFGHLLIGISNNNQQFVADTLKWLENEISNYSTGINKKQDFISTTTINNMYIFLYIKDNVETIYITASSEVSNTSDNDSSKRNTNSAINDNSSIYTNDTYNFTLNIPVTWKGKYTVKEANWAPEAEKTIDFNLIINGKSYGNIFSILVLKTQYNEDYVKNSPWRYITTNNGHVIAYSIAEEFNQELLNDTNALNIMKQMVNEDVPQIIKSIKFR